MPSGLILGLFFVLTAALTGGVLVRFLRLQPISGYIIAGIFFGSLLAHRVVETAKLAEIGAILLLFSIGLELSLTRLKRIIKIAVLGGITQIIITVLILFFALSWLHFDAKVAFILALGFSLSSTALVVKVLSDRGEMDTIHGEIMLGWLIIQDLAVIPIMIIIPLLVQAVGDWFTFSLMTFVRALMAIGVVLVSGKLIAPFIIHKIASMNSRELLVISAVALALGTALLTSFFGIAAGLGAFLAGLVISETQENHAIFAETRPLRDLFVALFFVTLGFLVKFDVLVANFLPIIFLVLVVLVIKFFVFLFISFAFHYHGKTAFQASLGLTQVGEFSFIIYTFARGVNLLTETEASIGISVALISILVSPILFKFSIPIWRQVNSISIKWPWLNKLLSGFNRKATHHVSEFKNHIVICGFGRMGSWIGKALTAINIPFVVVDYNQTVISDAKKRGLEAIYGDPSELEVLEQAGIAKAKSLVLAIADRVTQEELITKVQTLYPNIKIYSRAHFDEDFERLKFLRIEKIVQPEFEAALSITRSILLSQGKTKEEITAMVKGLRQSKAMKG